MRSSWSLPTIAARPPARARTAAPAARGRRRLPSRSGRAPAAAEGGRTRAQRRADPRARTRCSTAPASATLRRKPVFTTPNYFPPQDFEPHDIATPTQPAHRREALEPQHCYVCKQKYTQIHHFYDQLCPTCARVQFRQAHRAGRPARPRRAADRRPGQDRLPGRPQAAARGRAADRHHALPARLGGALRAGAGLRRVGRPAGDLRPRPAPHAERRGVLPRAAGHAATRLDFIINNACQTVRRPPEFYAHMMAGETRGAARRAGRGAQLLGRYEGLRGTACCRRQRGSPLRGHRPTRRA